MKPSPYFADRFKFFFKRFASPASLRRWFLKQAGEESGSFSFPDILKNHPKTLVFLPRKFEDAVAFLSPMPKEWFNNVQFCAHESLQALISAKRSHAFYFSDMECRFGEPVFEGLQAKIEAYQPEVCIYLDEPFLPRLYLAKVSGAPCRIGFNSESLYPFLNLSLHPDQSSEAVLIAKYYGVA